MRERWKTFPEAVQKQIIIQFGTGILFLILFFTLFFYFGDLILASPCLVFAGVLAASGGRLLYFILTKRCIRVQGECDQIEVTGIRKRIRYIHMRVGKKMLKIPVWRKMKHLMVGDTVVLYLADKERIYEEEGEYIVCNYFILEKNSEEVAE